MTSRFVSAAEEELGEASIFYENERSTLGSDFIEAVQTAVAQLEKFPEFGSTVGSGYRALIIQRFPYKIVYRIAANEIVIIAVAHQSRRPEYWKGRL